MALLDSGFAVSFLTAAAWLLVGVVGMLVLIAKGERWNWMAVIIAGTAFVLALGLAVVLAFLS